VGEKLFPGDRFTGKFCHRSLIAPILWCKAEPQEEQNESDETENIEYGRPIPKPYDPGSQGKADHNAQGDPRKGEPLNFDLIMRRHMACDQIVDTRKIYPLSHADHVSAQEHRPDLAEKRVDKCKQRVASYTDCHCSIRPEPIGYHTAGNHKKHITGEKTGEDEADLSFIPVVSLHEKRGGEGDIYAIKTTDDVGKKAQKNSGSMLWILICGFRLYHFLQKNTERRKRADNRVLQSMDSLLTDLSEIYKLKFCTPNGARCRIWKNFFLPYA